MKESIVLYAEDGMILTNGEIYGRQIFLAEGIGAETFTEITESAYEKILKRSTDI